MTWLAVFIGGGAGSLARFGLAKWLGAGKWGFPYGTLTANVLACMVLGAAGALVLMREEVNPHLRNGIMVGFCGGFSTFSTFTNESWSLLNGPRPWLGLAYVSISFVLCLGGLLLGQSLVKWLS